MILAFQERDQKELESKMAAKRAALEKSKTAPEIRKSTSSNKISLEEESTLLKPTVSSLRKVQPHDEPVTPYDKTFELETRLMQIDSVPKLGLPHWRPQVTR